MNSEHIEDITVTEVESQKQHSASAIEAIRLAQDEIRECMVSMRKSMGSVTCARDKSYEYYMMLKEFVEECVSIQVNMAQSVADLLNEDVYIFVSDAHDINGEGLVDMVGTSRTVIYKGERYMLSGTSQKIGAMYPNMAGFYKYHRRDELGFYVKPKRKPVLNERTVQESQEECKPTVEEILVCDVIEEKVPEEIQKEEDQDFSQTHITERELPTKVEHKETVDLVNRTPRKHARSVKKVTTPTTEEVNAPERTVEKQKDYRKNKMAMPIDDFDLSRWCKLQCDDKGQEHMMDEWVYKASKDPVNAIHHVDEPTTHVYFVPSTKFKIRLGGKVVYKHDNVGSNTASDLLYNLHKQSLLCLDVCRMATTAATLHLMNYQRHKKTSLALSYEIYTDLCYKIFMEHYIAKRNFAMVNTWETQFRRFMAAHVHMIPYNGDTSKDTLLDLLQMASSDVETSLLRHYPPYYTTLYNMTSSHFTVTEEDKTAWKLITQEQVRQYLSDPIITVLHFNAQFISLATNAQCPSFISSKPSPLISDCHPGVFQKWFMEKKRPAMINMLHDHLDHVAHRHGEFKAYLVSCVDSFFADYERSGLSEALKNLSLTQVTSVANFKAVVQLLTSAWVNSGSEFFPERIAKITENQEGDMADFIAHLKSNRTSFKSYHSILLKQENKSWADYCKLAGTRLALRRNALHKLTLSDIGSDVYNYLCDISFMVGEYVTMKTAIARNDVTPTVSTPAPPTVWEKVTTKISDLVDATTEKLAKAFISKLDNTDTASDIRKTVSNISEKMGLNTDKVEPSVADTIGLGVRTAEILVNNVEKTAMSVVEGILKAIYTLLNIEYKAVPLALDLKRIVLSFFLSKRLDENDNVGQLMLLINALQGSNLLVLIVDFLTTLAAVTWRIGKQLIKDTVKYVCESPLCPVCLFKNGAKTASIRNDKQSLSALKVLNSSLETKVKDFHDETKSEVEDFAKTEEKEVEETEPQGWLCWLWSHAESKALMVSGLIGVALVVMTGASTRLKNLKFGDVAKAIVESSKNIHYITLAFVALPKIFTIFSGAAVWLKECVSGDRKENTVDADIKKWLEDTAAILPDVFETACVASPDACLYYLKLYSEAVQIRGKLGDAKQQLAMAFKSAFETFGSMYHSVSAKSKMHQGHYECLHIQFAGSPGTGKTNLPPAVFSRIAEIMGEDKNNVPFPLKPDAKHHDNFSNQPFAVVDDMFVTSKDQNIPFYLFLFSGVPTVLPQAALPDKGRIAAFKAIVSNTNNPYMELEGVGDMKAIWRRRHLIKVTCIEQDQTKWCWRTLSHLRFTYNDNFKDSPKTMQLSSDQQATFVNMTFEVMLDFVEYLAKSHHLSQEQRIRQHGNFPLYKRMEQMKTDMATVTKLVAGTEGGANNLIRLNREIMADTLKRLSNIPDATLKAQLVMSEIQGRLRCKSAKNDIVDMAKRLIHVAIGKLAPSEKVALNMFQLLSDLANRDLPTEIKEKIILLINEQPTTWVDPQVQAMRPMCTRNTADEGSYHVDIPNRKGFSYMYMRREGRKYEATGTTYSVFLIPDDNPLDEPGDMQLLEIPDVVYTFDVNEDDIVASISAQSILDPANIFSAYQTMVKAYLCVDTKAFKKIITRGMADKRHTVEATKYRQAVEKRRSFLRKLFDIASRLTIGFFRKLYPIMASFLNLIHNMAALFIFWMALRLVGGLFEGPTAKSMHNEPARMRPMLPRSSGRYSAMVDHLSSKIYRMEFEYAGNVYSCQALGIRGNTFLVPKHVFTHIPKDVPISATVLDSLIVDVNAPNYSVNSILMLKNSFFAIPNKDAGVLVFHNFRTVANMSSMFLSNTEHSLSSNWLPEQAVMVARRRTKDHPSLIHTAVVSDIHQSKLAIDTTYRSDNAQDTTLFSNKTVYVSYSNGNGIINGDSGAPLMVPYGAKSKILGIIGASHETKMTIVPITSEEIETALGKIGMEWKVDITQPSFRIGVKPDAATVARFGQSPIVGEAIIPIHNPDKTKYFPTRISEFLPEPKIKVEPAILSDMDSRWLRKVEENPDVAHYTTESLQKYSKEELPPISYDNELKPVVDETIAYFKTKPAMAKLRIWTLHEAINGTDHSGSKGINMSTSPGLPYVTSGASNTKAKFFEQSTPCGPYRPTNLTIIEFKRIMSDAKNFVFRGELKGVHMKDEVVVVGKKTRTVYSTNVMTLTFERVVSGDFTRTIKESSDGTTEHTLGINPESDDWHNLASTGYFVQYVGSWDVKNWDANMPLIGAIATAQIRVALYKHAYETRNEEYPEWAEFLMYAIEADCASTFTQYGRVITYKNKGMLSGHPNTYLVNSMWHSLLARMIVRRIIKRTGLTHLLAFDLYKDIVRLKFGGDDVLWFVNPRFLHILNPEAISEGYAYFGYKITAADKSDNLRFTTIFEAEFLKQGFQIDPYTTKFVTKPSETIPETLVRWQTSGCAKAGLGVKEQLQTNMTCALRYAAFISEEYYNKLLKQLIEAAHAARFEWVPWSYDDMRTWIKKQTSLERLQIQAMMDAGAIFGSDDD